jgi:hypothetical protein
MSSISLTHLRRFTDDAGLLQHAMFAVPRRSQGYSADDNARALILVAREAADADDVAPLADLATVYLSFLEHAQDVHGYFKNFLDYDRRWSDTHAGADCQGRCVWALAEAASSSLPSYLRETAWKLFTQSVGRPELVSHPRTTAYYLLGLERAWAVEQRPRFRELARPAADRLVSGFRAARDDSWAWFDETITYGAGRVPHGLLAAAALLDDDGIARTALRSLDFLIEQTTRDGLFVPVGNRGWYPRGGPRAEFDQQPIEAMCMVEAALAARGATRENRYAEAARRAWRWFLGDNCRGLAVGDLQRGSCYDGLEADGLNQNQGAESTLALLISQQAMDKEGLDL